MNTPSPLPPDDIIARLRRDPVVIGLAHGLRGTPREDLVYPGGRPRGAFLSASNIEYRKRGGKFDDPKPLDAVATALLSILDRPLSPEELYHGIDDFYLQRTLDRLRPLIGRGDQTARELEAEIVTELERRKKSS